MGCPCRTHINTHLGPMWVLYFLLAGDFVLVLISVFVLHDMERAVVKLVKTCGQTHLPVCCYGYKNMFKLHNVHAFVSLRCCCKGKKVKKWKVTYPRKVTSSGVLFDRNGIECPH